jgi:hypothetical protein
MAGISRTGVEIALLQGTLSGEIERIDGRNMAQSSKTKIFLASQRLRNMFNRPSDGADKVFIVSNNKCGTTSFKHYFRDTGWKVGNQKTAELLAISELMDSTSTVSPLTWKRYISSAQVFQDVPFSGAGFLPWLLVNYPEAAFIHVSRPAQQWYGSLVNHHITRRLGVEPSFGGEGSLIWTKEIRKASDAQPYRGYPVHKIVQARNGTSDESPYDFAVLCGGHEFQQRQARAVLADRRSLLLDLDDLSKPSTASVLAEFLGAENPSSLPHSNRGDR